MCRAPDIRRPAVFYSTVKDRVLLLHITGPDLNIVHVPAIIPTATIHAEVIAQADRIARRYAKCSQVDLGLAPTPKEATTVRAAKRGLASQRVGVARCRSLEGGAVGVEGIGGGGYQDIRSAIDADLQIAAIPSSFRSRVVFEGQARAKGIAIRNLNGRTLKAHHS